jgi:hypothetical protein
MTRLRRRVSVLVALLGLAALASAPAEAKQRHKHTAHAPQAAHAPRVARSNVPNYVSKGVDRNPGGDNRYFSDTKDPDYLVGPGIFQRWPF